MNEHLKHVLDWAAGLITVASLMTWLPAVAAVLSVAWGCYRLYETHLNVKLLKLQLKEKEDYGVK